MPFPGKNSSLNEALYMGIPGVINSIRDTSLFQDGARRAEYTNLWSYVSDFHMGAPTRKIIAQQYKDPPSKGKYFRQPGRVEIPPV